MGSGACPQISDQQSLRNCMVGSGAVTACLTVGVAFIVRGGLIVFSCSAALAHVAGEGLKYYWAATLKLLALEARL